MKRPTAPQFRLIIDDFLSPTSCAPIDLPDEELNPNFVRSWIKDIEMGLIADSEICGKNLQPYFKIASHIRDFLPKDENVLSHKKCVKIKHSIDEAVKDFINCQHRFENRLKPTV